MEDDTYIEDIDQNAEYAGEASTRGAHANFHR